MTEPAWIAVDWGTTHLRAWGIGRNGAVLAEAASDDGMGRLRPEEFEPALLALVGGWCAGPTEILACGMVGSRQGWVEAPYRAVPCAALGGTLARPATADPRIAVHVVPGLKQTDPPDVMRGEETQIAGFLATHPRFDGVLCLPGTHTKWAHVSAGEVVSFSSYMTGEIYDLLAHASVLRHSVGPGWDDAAFAEALSDTLCRPERLAARLFSIRAEGLVGQTSPDAAAARLSGLLIGAELAGARPYWLGRPVAIVGSARLVEIYATALEAQGAAALRADGRAMTLAGLAAARALLKDQAP